MISSIDPQYLEAHNKEYTDFVGETTKTLIVYTRTEWYRLRTQYKKAAIWASREPWDQVCHISIYKQQLDKQQAQLKKYSVPVKHKEKTQLYFEQMYYCWMFIRTEVRK